MTSEIELAIKIGKAKLNPNHHRNIRLLQTLSKLDINLNTDPTTDSSLSYDLRELCTHGGDISLLNFVREYYNNITDSWYKEQLMFFFTGIAYLYPVSSIIESMSRQWKEVHPVFNFSSIEDMLDYAREGRP